MSVSHTNAPYLVTFAAGAMWQAIPCDSEDAIEGVVRYARYLGGERGIVIWDRRESRESRLIEQTAEFDALLVGPPTTGRLIRHRARRPTLAARMWARLARLVP